MRPESVAPFVVYLCHDSCSETGGIFEIGAGWCSRVVLERSEGVLLEGNELNADTVKQRWSQVNFFNSTREGSETTDSMTALMLKLSAKL